MIFTDFGEKGLEYRESPSKPLGGGPFFILEASERGLLERRFIQKSNDEDINEGLLVFPPYFVKSTYNFNGKIHKLDTVFIANHIEFAIQTYF